MAYSRIIHTKSEAVGSIPASGSLSYGEIAINYSDGHMYIKKADNTIKKVASTDFDIQIANLNTDVNSLTNTVNFLNLQFTQAEDLNFGRENINGVRINNSLTYGLDNEIGTTAKNSSTFGILNKTGGEKGIAIGYNNDATGNNSISVGANIKTPVDVAEFGTWTNKTTRKSSIRAANTNVAMTLANSATPIPDGGAIVGQEVATGIPRDMYAIRRNSSEVLLDVNIDGIVKTISFGDSSLKPGQSIKNIGEADALTGEVLIKAIRKLNLAQYNGLGSDRDQSTLYIVTDS